MHLVGVFAEFKLPCLCPWSRRFFTGPTVEVVLAFLFLGLADEVEPGFLVELDSSPVLGDCMVGLVLLVRCDLEGHW